MPNFFNYFALVLFFIIKTRQSLAPLPISICISVLVSVPTLYINSMIKQKSKTFIIFFLLFFSLVRPNIAIIHFYFGKNKLYQTFFAFIIIFLWSYNSFILYANAYICKYKFFSRCSLLYALYYTITSLHFTQLLLFIPIYI